MGWSWGSPIIKKSVAIMKNFNIECFVICTDEFMSGWGMAEGMTNRVVFPCVDMDEAKLVLSRVNDREEMTNAIITKTRDADIMDMIEKGERHRAVQSRFNSGRKVLFTVTGRDSYFYSEEI